jgi:hypothetical protein
VVPAEEAGNLPTGRIAENELVWQPRITCICCRALPPKAACGDSPCCFSSFTLAVRHALPDECRLVPSGNMLLSRLLCALLPILLAQGRFAELRWRRCRGHRLSHGDASGKKGQCDN